MKEQIVNIDGKNWKISFTEVIPELPKTGWVKHSRTGNLIYRTGEKSGSGFHTFSDIWKTNLGYSYYYTPEAWGVPTNQEVIDMLTAQVKERYPDAETQLIGLEKVTVNGIEVLNFETGEWLEKKPSKLPMSVEELPRFSPHYWLDFDASDVVKGERESDSPLDFETEAEAKQARAFIQLKKLCKAWNDGEIGIFKHAIDLDIDTKEIIITNYEGSYEFTFKDKSRAEKFISQFEDLLTDYYQIPK